MTTPWLSSANNNQGRYRSIAIVTLEAGSCAPLSGIVHGLLSESGINEFKWQKLRQARERFAAFKWFYEPQHPEDRAPTRL